MKEKWYTLKMAIHRVFSKEAVLASIKKTGVKKGAYQGGLTVLVILILVIANLVAGQLPSNINTLDLSEEQVLELSKTSKEYLGGWTRNSNSSFWQIKTMLTQLSLRLSKNMRRLPRILVFNGWIQSCIRKL